jgi:hypothetical protein
MKLRHAEITERAEAYTTRSEQERWKIKAE